VISLLAFRNITHRPWRSVLLFLGYGVGVGVMIVLLAIGDALLTQARDEKLVGGGAVTVLPEGLDVEVMKTGGIGGLYFSIDHSRFVDRQLLAAPRLANAVRAVAPQIDGKLLYVTARGRSTAVRALGEIPDATRAVGAAPRLAEGTWRNDGGDAQYVDPSPAALRHELDHFHRPPEGIANVDSWAEWHYFNVVSDDKQRWVFMSFIVAGDVNHARWGGKVAITMMRQGSAPRRYALLVPSSGVHFSTTDANVSIGGSTVTVLPDGRYAVRGRAVGEQGSGTVTVDLVVTPVPRAYFPGASLGTEELASGYAVPALRANASGTVCENGRCEQFTDAQSYHDHNWGIWRNVTWDWGAARAGAYTILYGRVIPPDSMAPLPPLFVYVVDSLGFLSVLRPARIDYTDARVIDVAGKSVRVPSRATFVDGRGEDTLRVTLDVEDALGTDMHAGRPERGEQGVMSTMRRPYFIQMKGTATIAGHLDGRPVEGRGTGFFETYR